MHEQEAEPGARDVSVNAGTDVWLRTRFTPETCAKRSVGDGATSAAYSFIKPTKDDAVN